jgi:hypothetical protein
LQEAEIDDAASLVLPATQLIVNPCSDWRDKQDIKDKIVGTEWEAAELYPAESRVQDEGNWSHLWVMPKGGRYSFGFIEGETRCSDKAAKVNEVQRPLAQRGDMSPLKGDGGLSERALVATHLGLKEGTKNGILGPVTVTPDEKISFGGS